MPADIKADAPELELDAQTQSGFVKWFQTQLPQDNQVIRIFDRKNCYSVHGENALFVARNFYRTTAVVKYLGPAGSGGLPSVAFNRSLFDQILRELLLEGAQHSIEIYEGFGASWTLARSASPGRLSAFDEEMFRLGSEGADLPVVAAVSLAYVDGQRVVGAAFLDAGARQLAACEFADDESLVALEALLVQLGAREVVLLKEGEVGLSASDARRLRDVCERVGCMATERPKATFSTKHLEQDLGKLLKSQSVEQHRDVLERSVATSALAAVIHFAELMVDAGAGGKLYGLGLYDPGRYMRVDAAAQRALNVMPSRLDANNAFSLYGLMNRARTAMGKRKLKVWLKQPLVDVGEIGGRHDAVESMVDDQMLREGIRDCLRGMPDIERLTRKLEANRCSLSDLCQMYRASSVLPRVEEAIRNHVGPHAAMLIAKYADALALAHNDDHLTKFEMLLEASIDLDRVPEEYVISAAYDPRLQGLRSDKDVIEEEILAIANAVARDLNLVFDKTIKLEWHKSNNRTTRCLRITQKEEKAVRSKLTKYLVLETRKDGTKFTSRALKDAAERLTGAAAEYEALQKDLVEQVVAVAHTFVEVWEGVVSLIGELDVLAGFAELACANPSRPYIRPQMLPPDAGQLKLMGSRHPCVEAQEGVCFVPNDCVMEKGKSWFQIITGPNMGGKSTFIRQVGAIVLMAQVGCFVPCDTAAIAARDCIFARVGAGDCQQRGVSTFMAEMLETAAILKGATSRSLVIIDELGRGTSTYDGFGLAWAISEYIMHAIGAPTLFATHFHELTELNGPGGVTNLHVDTRIDPSSGKLTMLYQIKEGACDQSFGIHVAESANFPPAVVEAAKQKLAELEGAAALDTHTVGDQDPGRKRKRGPHATDPDGTAANGAPAAMGGAADGDVEMAEMAQAGEDGDVAMARGGSSSRPAGEREAQEARRQAAAFLKEFGGLAPGALSGAQGPAAAAALLKGIEAAAQCNPVLRRIIGPA